MQRIDYTDNHYRTPAVPRPLMARLLPSFTFYCNFLNIVWRYGQEAKRGVFTDERWVASSLEVLRSLEEIGVVVDIEGVDNLQGVDGPVVLIGNHMSMMETVLLPSIVVPFKPATFVIKEALLNYPVFKHVMRSREPIAVTRTNPRQDLKTVLSEGLDRLQRKISIIVFPQTTRTHQFDPAQMSSIGVKLAKKAGVPIVPVALRTDCWNNGRLLKDFGRFELGRLARFAFDAPIMVEGKGGAEQDAVNGFIERKLQEWKILDEERG